MKLLLILLFSCTSVFAEDAVPKVQIIDGKKFFSLQNARRYHGTPTQPVIIKPLNNQSPITTVNRKKTDLPLTQPIVNNANLGGADKQKNDILSIFAPEDKTSSSLLPANR